MAGKRRAKGEGGIRKRKDGRWEGTYWVNTTEGIRKKCSVYGRTRTETSQKLRKLIADADGKAVNVSAATSVEKFYKKWHDEYALNYLKESTLGLYERQFRQFIIPVLGKYNLKMLTKIHVQNLVSYANKESGANQARIAKNALSSMLSYACDELQLISENPARNVGRRFMPKITTQECLLWSQEELEHFLNVARKKSPFYLAYALLAVYGLRRGEVLGLRVRDVDLAENTIHIRQQVAPVANKPKISDLKTKSSIRDLPISDTKIHSLLECYLSFDQSGDTLLFHTKNGTPIAPRNFHRDFTRITTLAGLPKIKMHSIRKMTACFLRDNGVDPKTTQKILGHTTLNMTIGVYQSSDRSHMANAICKLADIVR